MEMMEDGIRIVVEGYIRDGGRKTYANTNARVDDRTMGDEIKAVVDEIIDTVVQSIAEKRVKSVADGIEDESSNTQVSRGRKISNNNRKGSVLRGKKKISNNKKGSVLGRKKKISNNKRGVPCDGHCGKAFKSRWNMERHLDAQNLIKCEYCTTFYLRGQRNYQNHIKRVHKNYLKKPQCTICKSEFKGEKSLNQHLKKHDPNYGKFQCEDCKMYFTQKHSMERHKKTFHK